MDGPLHAGSAGAHAETLLTAAFEEDLKAAPPDSLNTSEGVVDFCIAQLPIWAPTPRGRGGGDAWRFCFLRAFVTVSERLLRGSVVLELHRHDSFFPYSLSYQLWNPRLVSVAF